MKINVKKISEYEFEKLDLPILFEDKAVDRVFGIISDGKELYKIGWQSTDIDPVIKNIDDKYCSIGIDLIFIIFELNTERILKKLPLDYFFYNTLIFNGSVYVITQLEIIKINIADWQIMDSYVLPEYFEDFELIGKNIFIKCLGNEMINIPG